ncbi:MAG: cell division protein FtsI [Lachnospiraceae bacterium]|nr:cell division protein FtsI [Lachnospiraceae bacterium]
MANRVKKERRFSKRMQKKLLAVFAFVLCGLVVLLLRIAQINITEGSSYAKQVLSQNDYDSQTLYARRGEIQDTNGRVLAYSEKVYNLVLDCYAINQNQEDYLEPTIEVLSEYFGLDETWLRSLITSDETKDSQYQVLKVKAEDEDQYLTEDEKSAYEDYIDEYADTSSNDLSESEKEEKKKRSLVTGVWFEEKYIRHYPLGSLASNTIGFANSLGDGIVGLEAYYDEQLQGTNGRIFGYLNENTEYQTKTIAPENGYTLVTTIDVNIQEIVEEAIAEFDETYGDDNDDGTAKHGALNVGVVVMDPNTGGILAMATNQSYDLEDPESVIYDWYTESEIAEMKETVASTDANGVETTQYTATLYDLWGNFCVSDSYEPGSTYKPITIAAALEIGAITTSDTFTCDGGEYITDTEIHCDVYPGAHGLETLEDALVNSCNDALMQIAARMHVSNFLKYQSLFNFGKKTGIDLPNESAGVIYTQSTMNEVELATCSFGQGFTCTMIQEIAAFSAVINGGYYYQPHVVDKILDEDGAIVKDNSSLLLKQVISSSTSDILKEYLESVVEDGTGKKARVPGYRVGGKTGTAEKIDTETGERADGLYLVSFIGAAPINDPEVVIYVVVDEPNVDNQASSSYAQNLFQSIALDLFPYMGIVATEEITDSLLAELGLTEEDVVQTDSVVTFQAFDSYGNLYNNARVVDGQVVDEDGNVIAGAYIDEDGTVYDGYMNAVSSIATSSDDEEEEEEIASNPDMATPLQESLEDTSGSTTVDPTDIAEEEEEE